MALSPSVAKILKEDEGETSEERELREAEEKEQDVSMGELAEQELVGQEREAESQGDEDSLSMQDEKFLRKIEQFGNQVSHLDAYLAVKKKRGTDYKIYSNDKENPNLFPYIASSRMFNDFLNFLNACFTMKAGEAIPQGYFPNSITKYISKEEAESREVRKQLMETCEDAQEFASKSYSDMNGFEAVVLAYEKTYDARYETRAGRREKAQAFSDILEFLKTGKQPRYEIDSAKRRLSERASELSKINLSIDTSRKRFEEKLNSTYFANEVKARLRKDTATLIGRPSKEIKSHMEGLPDALLKEVIAIYEKEVIPKVKQEIEDVKAGKRGSLREATTQKMRNDIENLQNEIQDNEAKLKNLGKAKANELRNQIAEAKEKLEEWRQKNFKRDAQGKVIRDPKTTQNYMRRQKKLDKLIAEKTRQISTASQDLSKEKEELQSLIASDRQLLTRKKMEFSARKKKAAGKESLGESLEELNNMLNPQYYNDEHVRILRTELMEQYLEEELGEELEKQKEEFQEKEKKLILQQAKFSKVEQSIAQLQKASRKIKTVIEEVDDLSSIQAEGRGMSQTQRENLGIGRATLRAFVGAEQEITDIINKTEKLLKQYESMDEYLAEVLSSFSFSSENGIEEIQEDIEEEISESQMLKNKLRTQIERDLESLEEQMDRLQTNLKQYEGGE